MIPLTQGQKKRMREVTPLLQFQVEVRVAGPALEHEYDVSCFGLDAAGRLSDDRYMVFYNQQSSPEKALSWRQEGKSTFFKLDLQRIPQQLERLVFALTIESRTLEGLSAGYIALHGGELDIPRDAQNELLRYDFRSSIRREKALMLLELYRKDGEWRVAARGQGFDGGLQALLESFGGEVMHNQPAQADPPPPIQIPPSVVSLSKKDAHHRVSLGKGDTHIRATAEWVDNGDGYDANDDLDLRAGILLPDGRMQIVHAGANGKLDVAPYAQHMGDVRKASVNQPGREIIHINPRISQLHGGPVAIVFSVYSAIANGPVAIADLKPIMRLEFGSQIVECRFDFSTDPRARAQFVYTYVLGLAVLRELEVDISLNGMVSPAGSENTPWLSWGSDGQPQISMKGPAVIKGHGGKAIASMLSIGNPRKYIV